jgi:hypothetical protein
MNVIVKLQNLKPDDLKYFQKPNLDVTRQKLLHLYSNMTHTHESKCTIWTTPHTKICDMQPNDIEINEKNTAFLYETNIQTKCHKKN